MKKLLLILALLGSCVSVPPVDHPVQVSGHSLSKEEVGVELVMIDFYADWCAPCRALAPHLEDLAKQYAGRLKVLKFDTEAEDARLVGYEIQYIPFVVVKHNGLEVYRGGMNGEMARKIVKKYLGEPNQ